MIFHWSVSDWKSFQVSTTPLSILNNVIVWMASIRPPISFSSSPFFQALGDCSKCANYNRYHRYSHLSTVLLVLEQGPSICHSFRSLWFSLCGRLGRQSPIYGKFSYFLLFSLLFSLLGLVFWTRLSVLLLLLLLLWTLLEKQRRAHKWCTPIDPHIWPSKNRTTS